MFELLPVWANVLIWACVGTLTLFVCYIIWGDELDNAIPPPFIVAFWPIAVICIIAKGGKAIYQWRVNRERKKK